MNTYPTLSQGVQSSESTLLGLQQERSTDGTLKTRAFYTAGKKTLTVVHPMCTNSDKATLDAFVTANLEMAFYFTWAATGVTYTCMFDASIPPKAQPVSYNLWAITVSLVEV